MIVGYIGISTTAVCIDDDFSLLLCAVVNRLSIHHRDYANIVCREKYRYLYENDQVLGNVVYNQLCCRSRDMNSSRISIWHELVHLFPVCRGCLWPFISD